MGRVHTVFLDLKPVALPESRGASEELVAWQVKGIQKWEHWSLFRRSHVGEDQPGMFVHRIGAMKEAVLQSAVGGLAWRFEDCAVDVEQPAVIAASDTLLADQAELQRGAPMRTVQFQQSNRTPLVAERHEIFAENPNPAR